MWAQCEAEYLGGALWYKGALLLQTGGRQRKEGEGMRQSPQGQVPQDDALQLGSTSQ